MMIITINAIVTTANKTPRTIKAVESALSSLLDSILGDSVVDIEEFLYVDLPGREICKTVISSTPGFVAYKLNNNCCF